MGLDGIALSTSIVLCVSCLTVSLMVASTLRAKGEQARMAHES
jgi:hypothetical protein